MKVSWRKRTSGYQPPDSKVVTSIINGRDKYHSDLYRKYLENVIINKKGENKIHD